MKFFPRKLNKLFAMRSRDKHLNSVAANDVSFTERRAKSSGAFEDIARINLSKKLKLTQRDTKRKYDSESQVHSRFQEGIFSEIANISKIKLLRKHGINTNSL